MSIKIVRIHPHFVGEVSGVDLSTPISDDERTIIEDGINEHGVLVFRDQNITDKQQAGLRSSA